jgi:hypothetical protein
MMIATLVDPPASPPQWPGRVPADLDGFRDSWHDERAAQLRMAARWLDARALSFLEAEEPQFCALLGQRLEALRVRGIHDHDRAERELRLLLVERLDRWRGELATEVAGVFLRLAERLTRRPEAPLASFECRTPYRLAHPASFLDAGPSVRALSELVLSRDEIWRRWRQELRSAARSLLKANATRIVDDFKQRLEDASQRLA